MAAKRLIKELEAYHSEPSTAVQSLEPDHEADLLRLTAVLRGPEGTAYQGGLWTLTLSIPPSYPAAPPSILFRTPCCHPNVNFSTGEICLDLLKSAWTPAYGLVATLEAVQQMMANGGDADSPLNLDLARLVREGDLVAAEGLVRFYTSLYAME